MIRQPHVPAVASSAHAGLKIVGHTKTLEVIASVLASSVRMHNDLLRRFPAPDCHQQGIQCQFSPQRRIHGPCRPPHVHTGQPRLPDTTILATSADISDVGDPDLVWGVYCELAQQIIGRNDGRSACNPAWSLLATDCLNLVHTHETFDTVRRLAQITKHTPDIVNAMAGDVGTSEEIE